MYYVYVIESEEDKRYYFGQTEDIEKRIIRHNKGNNRSTKSYIPWQLKWWKEYETRSEAMKVETEMKKIKKREGIKNFVNKNNFRGVAQPG